MSTENISSITTLLRRARLTAGILAVVIVEAASASEWQQRWSVAGTPELAVSSTGIDLIVEPGTDGTVEAVLEADGAALGNPAAKVDHRVSGNTITIDARARPFLGARHLRLRIRVPRHIDADLRSRSGALSVRGLEGNLRLETSSGTLDADSLGGRVTVATRTGTARLSGRFDFLHVRTRSGAIQADVLPGSRLASDWEIQSASGSVSLRVPSSLAAEIQARTLKGEIRSDLPLVVRGRQDRESLRGELNGGGPTLLVWSDRGSIRLSAI
ncbi:MAG TPA: DUF4097 family beta strand repeat-containing protein [Thermoanaerobaculia bacterium]|nr:DUF4097 family beta strand repeat-containing protein [Thermoanaerobaculia bacterium]